MLIPMISPWYPHHRWLRFHVLAMRRQGSGAGGGDVSGGSQDCHRFIGWDELFCEITGFWSILSIPWVKNMWEVGGSSQFTYVALTPSTVGQRHQSIRGCVVKSVAFGCRFMSSPIVLGCVCRLDLGRNFSAMVWCLRCVRTGQHVSF